MGFLYLVMNYMFTIRQIIKVILAVLLLLCLAPMPYGYYQLVRFVAMLVFAYLAYCHFKSEEGGLGFLFVALALLFQPFFKIALGRTLWNIMDVLIAIGLIFLVVKGKGKTRKQCCDNKVSF